MTTRLFVSERLSNGAEVTLDADRAHYKAKARELYEMDGGTG